MENANIDPVVKNVGPNAMLAGEPMPDAAADGPPMEAPRVILGIMGGFFVVLLGGLLLIDAFGMEHGPVSVASPATTMSTAATTG